MKEQTENIIKQDQAELCRIFALHCDSTKSYYYALLVVFQNRYYKADKGVLALTYHKRKRLNS